MKKIGLIGLLIASSICADPGVEETQVAPLNSTSLQKTKLFFAHVLATGKEKTVGYCKWAWHKMPNTPEPIKVKLNTAGTWLALKSAIAKTWLVNNTPMKVQDWFSTVKTSCKPAWEKTHQTVRSWFTEIKSAFN